MTATAEEILLCIRAHKTLLVPVHEEDAYLRQVEYVARARKLTITRVTAYYGEGMYGNEPPQNEPAKEVRPVGILDATASLVTNVVSIRLYAPLLLSDVRRLLGPRAQIPAQRKSGR